MDPMLLTINQWIVSGTALAGLGCFLWGMVSVLFSPCHLASIPLIVGYVGGQNELVEGKKAAAYAGLFTLGLFITIAVIGIICALLGRLLGDVGPWWSVAVGLMLIWVALDMLGLAHCSMSGSLMSKLALRGYAGAFVLGLAYGVLSGSCTFGFIAPILAIITVHGEIATGTMLIVLFGLGHCLPIAIAGSSASLVRKILNNERWQTGGTIFKKLAGIIIGLLGLYFIAQPLL